RKALDLSPRQAEVWVWLARALHHTDTPENRVEAARLFDHAVALEPKNGNRYIIRGIARLSGGDAPAAEADFQKARALRASRPLLLHADAFLASHRRDYETSFQKAGEILKEKQAWPSHVGNWLALGFQLRRDAEIRDRFEEWCRNNPEYPEVYALKAQV